MLGRRYIQFLGILGILKVLVDVVNILELAISTLKQGIARGALEEDEHDCCCPASTQTKEKQGRKERWCVAETTRRGTVFCNGYWEN